MNKKKKTILTKDCFKKRAIRKLRLSFVENTQSLHSGPMRPLYIICFLLVFFSCRQQTDTHLTKITAKTIAVDSSVSGSKIIDSIISPYKDELATKMQEILSYAPIDFTKNDGELQSTLGNLVADLSFDMANPVYQERTNDKIDFVLFNHGGLRASIPEGLVTTESAFQLMPFENDLVVVQITGDKVNEMMEYFIRNQRAHPLSSNIELILNDTGYSLKINGQPFDPSKSYIVLTNDFLQNGGDRMHFLAEPEKLTVLNYKVRDAIIDYFKKTDTLRAIIDNRVIKDL